MLLTVVEEFDHVAITHPEFANSEATEESEDGQQMKEYVCPICISTLIGNQYIIDNHLSTGECQGPPVVESPKKVLPISKPSSSLSRQVKRARKNTKKAITEEKKVDFLDARRHERRRQRDISERSILSLHEIKRNSQEAELRVDCNQLDFLLESISTPEYNENLLHAIRSLANQHIKIPPEAIQNVIAWMLSENVSLRESMQCDTVMCEVLSSSLLQWMPLDPDWHTFIRLVEIFAQPHDFVRQKFIERSERSTQSCIEADDDDDDDLVSPIDLLRKNILVLKLFVSSFDNDMRRRKLDSSDLSQEGLLRALVNFAVSDQPNTSVESIVVELYDSCNSALFAHTVSTNINANNVSVDADTLFEIYSVAEYMSNDLLYDCFPEVRQ